MTGERLKKINAVLGLLTMILLITHSGYMAFCYFIMTYPSLIRALSWPLAVAFCLHAMLAMSLVFMNSDGTSLALYPGYNKSTVVQRISAAVLFPMLLIHLWNYQLLSMIGEAGSKAALFVFAVVEILFFGTVFTHIAVSFSRALITLGLLTSREKQRTTDKAMIIICAALFALTAIAIVRAQVFLTMGAA